MCARTGASAHEPDAEEIALGSLDVEHDAYYEHLWLCERDGAWRVAYDLALPARR